jgi:LysR family glycine cleavage system transcriptional activator
LRLSVLQSFASLWLLPRLAAFKQAAARPRRRDRDLGRADGPGRRADYDAAIRFGTGRWPASPPTGCSATHVLPGRRAGPARAGRAISAAALDRTVLFDIVQAPDLWSQYLQGVGLTGYPTQRTAQLRQRAR